MYSIILFPSLSSIESLLQRLFTGGLHVDTVLGLTTGDMVLLSSLSNKKVFAKV